ncbi:MAG TPA: hypothetical protein VFM18_02410 [Methanosarcina sp.]|nr:hypothetical protein [Methanosarcina sp.]
MTEEKKVEYKKGDKVRIISNPPSVCYGYNQVGDILTVESHRGGLLECDGFTKNDFGDTTGWIDIDKIELVKEENMGNFSKKDLKLGMRVVYRNGDIRVIGPKGRLHDESHDRTTSLSNFSEDLMYSNGPSPLDIMEVYDAPVRLDNFFDFSVKGYLLFKRVEETPAQKELRDIEEQLKALQDKAAELRKTI